MDFARGPSPTSTDDYFVTAHQIFEGCGVESTSSLQVDALMDKFAPYVETNKAEFSFLKSLLDPEQCNPEINVSKLANALHQYSESQKSKMDLDESFNLRNGQGPHDADSGISTDGLQILEDLQCELKEKEYLASQLRSQLDYSDRQHEETIAALTSERDSLRRHLNILREENATLTHVRRDYDETCERLCSSGVALDEAKRELECLRRHARITKEQLATLEADKLSLQDLLSKSKDECHRINEMYAARQSALLEENETLKGQHADLSCRLQDQDEFMQQVIKDKVLLEIELKDTLNKSNQTHLRLDRSIDVSYTEEQMLSALDALNADSRFSTGNRILEDESFMNALAEDQGRCTNLSLFDEIRMSFNFSRLTTAESDKTHCEKCCFDNSLVVTATQTDDSEPHSDSCTSLVRVSAYTQTANKVTCYLADTDTQTDVLCHNGDLGRIIKTSTAAQTDDIYKVIVKDFAIQTDTVSKNDIQKIDLEMQTDEIDKAKKDVVDFAMLTDSLYRNSIEKTDLEMLTDTENDLYCGGDNAQNIKYYNVVRKINFESSFDESKTEINNDIIKVHIESQTDAMQNELYRSENNIQFLDAKDYNNTSTQTVGKFIRKPNPFIKKARKLMELKKKQDNYRVAETQTNDLEPCANNNNAHCTKCRECDVTYTYTLERDVKYAQIVIKELKDKIRGYEENLTCLEDLIDEGTHRNEILQSLVDDLRAKIDVMENACESHRDMINNMVSTNTCCVQSQTDFDYTSVSTQAELPCAACETRKAVIPHRGLRRFFWWVQLLWLMAFLSLTEKIQSKVKKEQRCRKVDDDLVCNYREPLKCLFQLFAVLCFVGALSLLYGVSRRGAARCGRGATPWSWLHAQDIMDLLLRIEYTAEVPM